MTDDLVKRLYNLPSYEEGVEDLAEEAADRIEQLQEALQKIVWIATPDHEEARYKAEEIARAALKEGKDEK